MVSLGTTKHGGPLRTVHPLLASRSYRGVAAERGLPGLLFSLLDNLSLAALWVRERRGAASPRGGGRQLQSGVPPGEGGLGHS